MGTRNSDNEYHGYGILTMVPESRSDINRYEGMFRNGLQHGIGILYFTDGARWVGEWRSGEQYKGFNLWPDGSVSIEQKNTDGTSNEAFIIKRPSLYPPQKLEGFMIPAPVRLIFPNHSFCRVLTNAHRA